MGESELLLPLVDEENICLPLPVNVISRYWDIRLPMAEAEETAKKYAGFGGSILIEGIESAERHGLACKIARSSLPELKEIIDSGIPPIVMLPGIPEITQHASVITGYSDEENTMLHYVQKGGRDGEQQEGAIPQDVFEKGWSEEANFIIVIAPPDALSSVRLAGSKSDRMCLEAERKAVLGDAQGALELLEQAASLDPKNPVTLNLLGGMLNKQGSPECVKYYERCIGANPRSYLAHNGLGNFYLKTGKFGDAEKCYTRAIAINPKRSAKIYKNRAYLREKRGGNSDAKKDLQSYLECFPRAPDRGVIEKAIREI
ncbi:MAG: tetratricopeptide repeat protein [Nitrosopumilus sp. H13]|nr:MAG: tetratricopeptide repeat protein [Nitrosopumilus sp. H13]